MEGSTPAMDSIRGLFKSGSSESSLGGCDVICGEEVDNAGHCTSRLAQLLDNAKFSDVTLVVGDRRYQCHRLLLANASCVLEQMLTSASWIEAGKAELSLQEDEDCCEVFEDFLRYIYTGRVTLSLDSVLGLLVLADKYNISDLEMSCSAYMRRHLVGPADRCRAVVWYQYALACNSAELQQACLDYIVYNMDVVMLSSDWVCLERGNLIAILRRSDVIVASEYSLLQAVVRWLTDDSRSSQLLENLAVVLPFLRFPMILPEHLAEFEQSAFERAHHQSFASHLLTAYRYHALSIKGADQHASGGGAITAQLPEAAASSPSTLQFAYRNYTDESYSVHVEVVRKSIRTCPRVSSKVEKPLSLPTTVCNAGNGPEGGQCKMKVTFYPQGFYTTSLWNGQLNLAKSSDVTKIVVAHRGGVELRHAGITVAVCAQRNGVRYVDYARSSEHVFDTYGTYEFDDVIGPDKIHAENSAYIVDGSLYVKVFVRPISFHANNVASL